jgi:1-acyl-sn-glycerol-3-phosphate acyltransferase
MESTPLAARAEPTLGRALRYVWRVPILLSLVVIAIPLGGAVALLPAGPGDGKREPLAQRIVRHWSRWMLRGAFGFRIVSLGEQTQQPVLFVANHVSWMDIQLLHTQRAACFVAKAEIARWPLVGWLAARAGTIFLRRGNPASLSAVIGVMGARLRGGRAVAVFPEGGIEHEHTGITKVRTFHARVFQCALDAQVPIQPVALTYRRNGCAWNGATFRHGEGFLGNFLRLLGEPPLQAEVHFLTPLSTPAEHGRRALADAARAAIAACLSQRA